MKPLLCSVRRITLRRVLGLAATAAAVCGIALGWVAVPVPAHAQSSAYDDDDDDRPVDYWDEKNRGWFFYEKKPKKAKPKPPPPPVAVQAPPPAASAPEAAASAPKNPDLVRFEALQKRAEETRNIAIMNPSEENMRAFLATQKEVLDHAVRFGEVSTQVVMATPALNPEANGARPTAPNAAEVYDREQRQNRVAKFAKLSQTHGFFFFFRSDCPYCHRFMPTLYAFSRRTGITITAISLDGQPMPDMPIPFRRDNGIATRLNVEQVPALYLVEPSSGRILPVGYGVMSPSELENRIDVVSDPQFAKNVPSVVQNVSGEMPQ